MSNVYFTSDTHFGHANIASKNSSKWKEGYRDYDNLEEMNQNLIKGINKTVNYDDTLYHLGDWSFGGIENIWKFRKQIVCKNVHLILGNHDHHIEENKILPNCHWDGYPGYSALVDGPSDGSDFQNAKAQDLFESVSHYKELKLNGRIFILSHYAHRVWHGSHKGWLHLYAHSHDSLEPYGKSHDVGIDTAIRVLGEARPFRVSEIIDIMDTLPMEFPDHHDLTTNTGKPQGSKSRRK